MSCKYLFLSVQFLSWTHIHHSIDAGVVGDYSNARIFVRNSSLRYKTGILTTDKGYISDEQLSTLNATEGIIITVVIAWSTRLLFAEVVSTENNSQLSFNSR